MIINTPKGKIEGINERGFWVFKGIRYAKAPMGALRFERPQEVEPWDGVFKAYHFGNMSIQREQTPGSFYQKEFYNNPDFSVQMDEDCLFLNIWMPEISEEDIKKEALPVAVYVHGGAFMGGAGSNLPFVPDKLVEKGVIVITINYRLGVWGFIAHDKISKGNLGLWDQMAAFKWIKTNISYFGGDKNNITAFGQSAGAMSLQILALSEQAKGLFNKMILQSGGGYNNPLSSFKTFESAKESASDVLHTLGISEDADVKDLLKQKSVSEIQEAGMAAIGKSFQSGKGFAFVPVIDGELLADDGNKLIAEDKYMDIPYILGANKNDLTTEQLDTITTENNMMHVANVNFAKKVNEKNSCYVYYFTHQLPGDDEGAFHSAELWYVFGSLDYCWRPFAIEDYTLSEEMVKYWTNFMKNGNPNEATSNEWRTCTKEDSYVHIFA